MRTLGLIIVKLLNYSCMLIDSVLYRPVIVLIGKRFPFWWNCQLAKLSVKLDEKWGLGYWQGLIPGGACEACGRRAATVYIGGWSLEPDYEPDPEDDQDYLAYRRVYICQWCTAQVDNPVDNEDALKKALADAAARSISWRWKP